VTSLRNFKPALEMLTSTRSVLLSKLNNNSDSKLIWNKMPILMLTT
jgi:hypothetical protein